MTSTFDKLKKFDNQKLTDIVKNYKQYGYDIEIRNTAIEILGERGISEEDLKLSGNYENVEYNSAEDIFDKYNKSSKLTFFFYGLFIITNLLAVAFMTKSELLGSISTIINFVSIISFLLFLIKSLINQNTFYKAIGKENAIGDQIVYVFIGMPLYIFIYFYYSNKMKEELNLIE